MRTLDFYAGDRTFESALRAAVMDVVRRFDELVPVAKRSGRTYRVKGTYDHAVKPGTYADARAILDGIPVVDRSVGVAENAPDGDAPDVSNGRVGPLPGAFQKPVPDFDEPEVPTPPAGLSRGPVVIAGGVPDFDDLDD